jgi:hypothetical protein
MLHYVEVYFSSLLYLLITITFHHHKDTLFEES